MRRVVMSILWLSVPTLAAAGLLRNGWTRNSLMIGEVVAVTGYLAENGTKTANSSTVTVNGRRLFAGSSADTEGANPPPPQ